MKTENRNEEPKPRSIILSVYLWNILDQDAARCRRSATKQIEAILARYYDLEPRVDLDEKTLSEAAQVVSPKARR